MTIEAQKKVPVLRFPRFEGEWVRSKIDNLGRIITGSTPKTSKKEYYNEGERLFVSPADIHHWRYLRDTITKVSELGFSTGRKVRKGSSLFVCIGSTIGKVAQAEADCITNQQINAVVPNTEQSDDFVFSLLENKASWIKTLTATQAVPIINKTTFSNVEVYLPTLPEQQKIAAFLTSIDTRIQQLSQKVELLEEYKKGVMQELFAQEIRFKDEQGRDFPDWEEKALGEIASRVLQKNKVSDVTLVLTNSATAGIVSQQDYFNKDIANADNLMGYYVVLKDDFVYNPRISSSAPVGPIKRNKLSKGVMSPLYTVFRFERGNINFYEQFFESTEWHKYMRSIANYGARHDRMNITNADFLKMPVPAPTFEEQQKIATFLAAMDNKIQRTQQQLEHTQAFKRGLLQQMFV